MKAADTLLHTQNRKTNVFIQKKPVGKLVTAPYPAHHSTNFLKLDKEVVCEPVVRDEHPDALGNEVGGEEGQMAVPLLLLETEGEIGVENLMAQVNHNGIHTCLEKPEYNGVTS